MTATTSSTTQLLSLFERHQGYLTTGEVVAAGLPTSLLTRLERRA
jgi:Transcriptional regulator, AbiEi antitoxin